MNGVYEMVIYEMVNQKQLLSDSTPETVYSLLTIIIANTLMMTFITACLSGSKSA